MRLIDGDALMEDIRKHSASYFADDFAREWVDKQPTIEPERKKGKWINIDETEKYKCSECGRIMWFSSQLSIRPEDYKFCPNCGADCRGNHDADN